MLAVTEYKNNKLGVWDSDDNTLEYYNPESIRHIVEDLGININGVILEPNINPMYTICGLTVNLLYRRSICIGKFRAALLQAGERWGSTFSSEIVKPTLAIFDMSTSLSRVKYPSGQYICSYYVDTFLNHEGSLKLDASVSSWYLSKKEVSSIKDWVSTNIK